MRLRVFWPTLPTKSNKVSTFHIQPAHGEGHRNARGLEIYDLKRLIPRINTVGRKLFTTDFISVTVDERLGRLELQMKKGITQSRKRDFDTFRGWIELCALE
jgi:hypothetical protein